MKRFAIGLGIFCVIGIIGLLVAWIKPSEKEPPAGMYESICIPAHASKNIEIKYDMVIRKGKVFPIVGDKQEGCLILRSYFTHDFDGDGYLDRGAEYAIFVDDDYDHCCIEEYE